MSEQALGTFEAAPGGGQKLVLLPPTGQTGMAIWSVVPIGILLLGLALTVSGRCFSGLLITGIGVATSVVAARTFFRRDSWVLRPGAATRQRAMLGMSSQLEVTGVEKVLCKASRDSDERRVIEIGLQHPGGWTPVGASFEHDERAQALAQRLADALAVGLEFPA